MCDFYPHTLFAKNSNGFYRRRAIISPLSNMCIISRFLFREKIILMAQGARLYLAIGIATSAIVAGSPGTAFGASPQQPFRISLEPAYFAGRFGSAHMFRVYDLPLSVIYRRSRLRIHVELPYVAISGTGRISGGAVLRGGHQRRIRRGVGDLWLSGQYRLNHAAGILPSVSPFLKAKIPLAARSKGLGTGKEDAEFGARLEWRVGGQIFPYLALGYRINGRARRLRLHNALTYQIGTSVAFADHQYLTAVFIGHSAFQYHVGITNSLVIAYNVILTPTWGLETYVDHGLSRNSPAIGVGLGVTASF